jgi:hypothetical protein
MTMELTLFFDQISYHPQCLAITDLLVIYHLDLSILLSSSGSECRTALLRESTGKIVQEHNQEWLVPEWTRGDGEEGTE